MRKCSCDPQILKERNQIMPYPEVEIFNFVPSEGSIFKFRAYNLVRLFENYISTGPSDDLLPLLPILNKITNLISTFSLV